MTQGLLQLATTGTVSGLQNNQAANAALAALAGMIQGGSAPTAATTGLASMAGLLWHDTTNNLIKLRDQSDANWILDRFVDETNKVVTPCVPYEHGRLSFVSSTQIAFKPYKGNRVQFPSRAVAFIPSTGIVAANTSVFVNGAGGQNVAASTVYYVYLFFNSGTPTIDFSTSVHATDANSGIEIKTGDSTHVLLGMVRTNSNANFVDSPNQRFTVSWFNRLRKALTNNFTVNRSVSGGTFAEINTEIRVEFLVWSDDTVNLGCSGSMFGNASSVSFAASIGIDGATPEDANAAGVRISGVTNAETVPIGINFWKTGLPEGYHFATLLGSDSAGTTTWTGGAAAGSRCTMNGSVNA